MSLAKLGGQPACVQHECVYDKFILTLASFSNRVCFEKKKKQKQKSHSLLFTALI